MTGIHQPGNDTLRVSRLQFPHGEIGAEHRSPSRGLPLVNQVKQLHNGDIFHERFASQVIQHQHIGFHQGVHFPTIMGKVCLAGQVQKAVGAEHQHIEAPVQQAFGHGVHQEGFPQAAGPRKQKVRRGRMGIGIRIFLADIPKQSHAFPLADALIRQQVRGEQVFVIRFEGLRTLFR